MATVRRPGRPSRKRLTPELATEIVDGLGPGPQSTGGPRTSDELEVVDRIIAANLTAARQESGISVHVLVSRMTGRLTAQAYYRWERGLIKLSAARLWELSIILEKPLSYFFDGARGFVVGMTDDPGIPDIISPQGLEVLRMVALTGEDRRNAVVTLLRACLIAEVAELELAAPPAEPDTPGIPAGT